jgi:NAD(P)H-dependent flavin oxidoreductase YrpB (nitropropane dioxygenase family)
LSWDSPIIPDASHFLGLSVSGVVSLTSDHAPTQLDYTKGALDELVDIIIAGGAKLFVSAVGVAPRHVVDKLHDHGILYMNMIGHPKHVAKACAAGADIICAQGAEAGGHTGETPTR